MLIPRRVRRRLLLPPGWVALGFLLLLGCQALQPWAGQLERWNMLQVTMFPLKADTSYLSLLKKHPEHNSKNEFNPYAAPLQNIAASTLQKMRPWYIVEFSGNHVADFLSAATIESAIQKIIADTSHAVCVCIRFLPRATYANLVKVLNTMDYTNQKKYWLDIHHSPTAVYAITDLPTHTKPGKLFRCEADYFKIQNPPVNSSFERILEDFWKNLMGLGSQPWQASTLLLVVISSLSLWQILRLKLGRP